jgi:hypothetical protein
MQQNQTLSQRFQQYRASKAVLFWACAGSVVVATVVGFSWGGWVTGGSARDMAADSAAQARQELAAVVCVDRFMAAPDAGVQLTALQEITSPYAQGKFVEEGGWAIIMPPSDTADRRASAAASAGDRRTAGLCAAELAKRAMPTPGEAALIDDEAIVAQ